MSTGGWILTAALALVALSLILPTPRRLWSFVWSALKIVGVALFHRPRHTRPELARLLCEDLGPTFIKFGQIVASSAGLFPQPYVDEFRHVLDRVKPFPFADVERTLREDLGAKADDLVDLDPTPLASASIAQVHTAKLKTTGALVVVKVQRPGIVGRTRADVKLLRLLASAIEAFVKDAELANPTGIVDDFATTLAEELDFRREAANLTRFNEIMAEAKQPEIRAPVPCDGYVTPRVLVMERFSGTRIDDVVSLRARVADPEAKLIQGMLAWFESCLRFGFFHGDVHAGNLMVLDNGDLGFLDFGIVGRFDETQRRQVLEYVMAFVAGDFEKLADVMAAMGSMPNGPPVDRPAFIAELAQAYEPLRSRSFGDLNYAEMLPNLQRIASRHRLKQPREFVLVIKQLLYFDRYAKLIAPQIVLFTDPRLVAGLAQHAMAAAMAAQAAKA